MRSPALQFFGGLATLLLLLLTGLQVSCTRYQRDSPYRPRNYRSHAHYLRSSAIRQREADAELHSTREAQRHARALTPATY